MLPKLLHGRTVSFVDLNSLFPGGPCSIENLFGGFFGDHHGASQGGFFIVFHRRISPRQVEF